MTGKKKDPKEVVSQIEHNLGGLLGALGDALGDMVNKLEDGAGGSVNRDMTIDTEKGPLRAHAGIRVRMGGLSGSDSENATSAPPKPVNPDRAKPTARAPSERPLSYELLEDGTGWILTADMPGVTSDEIDLRAKDDVLHVTTTGKRRYAAAITLGPGLDTAKITRSLRNGILTLEIPQGTPA